MRDFFRNIFGGGAKSTETYVTFKQGKDNKTEEVRLEAPPARGAEERDAESENLRKKQFRKLLNEFTGTELNNIQYAVAEKELCGDGPFPKESAEFLRAEAKRISIKLFAANPDAAQPAPYDPSLDKYDKMVGARRKAFEAGVMAYFQENHQRAVNADEMDTARKMFELDADLQAEWPKLYSEEVTARAKQIAERLEKYDVRAAGK